MRLEGMQSRTKGAAERWGVGATQDRGKHFHKVRLLRFLRLWDTDKPENKKKRELKEASARPGSIPSEGTRASARGWTPLASWSRTRWVNRWDLLTALSCSSSPSSSLRAWFPRDQHRHDGGHRALRSQRFVDLVFTIDILVQMNTMYFDPKGKEGVQSQAHLRALRAAMASTSSPSFRSSSSCSSLTNTASTNPKRDSSIPDSSAFCVS